MTTPTPIAIKLPEPGKSARPGRLSANRPSAPSPVPVPVPSRLAKPGDYARWGAEFGFAAARSRRPVHELKKAVGDALQQFLALGASQDEADLYSHAFDIAYQEGLDAAATFRAARPIRINTDDGSFLVKDGEWKAPQASPVAIEGGF